MIQTVRLNVNDLVVLNLVAVRNKNFFIEVIRSLRLKGLQDFRRVWTLMQNHGWYSNHGIFFWLTAREAGGAIAEIDGIDDSDYLTYYSNPLMDDRAAMIQMAIICHPDMCMIMPTSIERAWVSLGLKTSDVPAYVLGLLDVELGVAAENTKRLLMREMSKKEATVEEENKIKATINPKDPKIVQFKSTEEISELK